MTYLDIFEFLMPNLPNLILFAYQYMKKYF